VDGHHDGRRTRQLDRHSAEIDLRVGGTATLTWDTGDKTVDHRKAFEGNTTDWACELDELVAYLHA
jgi:hypothetical protein